MFSQASVFPSVHGGGGVGGWEGVSHDTPRQTAPLSDTMVYGQQAGGTHPTGMNSCFNL